MDCIIESVVKQIDKVSKLVKTKQDFIHWLQYLKKAIFLVKIFLKNMMSLQKLTLEANCSILKYAFFKNQLRIKSVNGQKRKQNLSWQEIDSCFQK